jgi:glycolate oxidase FAD binding subunit
MAATGDWHLSPELAALGDVRAADGGDAIDGVRPRIVLEPSSPAQMAAALAWVSRERLATVVRGRGTKLEWGRVPSHVDVVLSTSRLNALVAHRHGDLTATVQAGMTVSDLNRQLSGERQWLPLDTPFAHATIGGLLATNESGPLRHRFGTPRDLLIGITLALTDGRLVKSGGHVVKNVAGYDLGKLVSGSFGGLAVIVDATFKLLPIPPASQTVAVRYADAEALARDAASLAASQLDPIAVDLHTESGPAAERYQSACVLLVRFASSPDATAVQADAARALLTGDSQLLSGESEAALWAEQVRRPWHAPGVVVRVSWLPAQLPRVLALVEDLQHAAGGAVTLTARAAAAAGLLRIDASDDGAARAIERLRGQPDVVSNVVVLRQSAALKRRIDPWGPAGSPEAVLRSLKGTFDPAGILNAGRGPV